MEKKYYVVKQIDAIGNGYSETVALVKNPQIQGAGIHATKVGEPAWEHCKRGHYVFKNIPAVDFIVIGNATCEECSNPRFDTDVDDEHVADVTTAFDENN